MGAVAACCASERPNPQHAVGDEAITALLAKESRLAAPRRATGSSGGSRSFRLSQKSTRAPRYSDLVCQTADGYSGASRRQTLPPSAAFVEKRGDDSKASTTRRRGTEVVERSCQPQENALHSLGQGLLQKLDEPSVMRLNAMPSGSWSRPPEDHSGDGRELPADEEDTTTADSRKMSFSSTALSSEELQHTPRWGAGPARPEVYCIASLQSQTSSEGRQHDELAEQFDFAGEDARVL